MKKLVPFLLIGVLGITLACSQKGKSTQSRNQAYDDPISAMRFPDREAQEKRIREKKRRRSIEIRAGNSPVPELQRTSYNVASEILDKNQLRKIPAQPSTRWVRIAGNNVPLRQGPGAQYKKVGYASRGETFELLSVRHSQQDNKSWYFAQNSESKKFFISDLVATITESNEEKGAPEKKTGLDKEVIQKRKRVSVEKVRTTFDPTPPLPKNLRQSKHITLNFEGTEVYDVITTFCELLQIDYLIEGNLKGKVTLQTFNKIPVQDLYVVLEQILALHNITVVKSGNFYRFLPITESGKKPLGIYYGDDPLIPSEERMIIQIIPLKYISVGSMKKIIAPLLTANSTFIDVPETKNIMLVEMASNVKRILKVVEALDIDKLASSDIQLFRLSNADSETVVAELVEVFSSMGYNEALGNSINFLSLQRLNSILVVNAFESILPTIEFWIKKLDQPISAGDISTFVYYVQNGDALQLSDLLNAMFESQKEAEADLLKGFEFNKASTGYKNSSDKKKDTPKAADGKNGGKPGSDAKKGPAVLADSGITNSFHGDITLIPDKDTNSLIIRTNPRNYPALLELIKKLDLFPQQVLIEVLIIDLTLDAETRAGLEWALKGTVGSTDLIGGVSQTPGAGGVTLGSQIGNATASLLQPGGSFLASEPNKLIALLQAFASDSKANVLANPILVTSDNKPANISIADEIPIESSVITTPTAGQPLTQSTIEFRSVGIKLDIIPKINSDNFVNLKISQEISSQGPFVGSTPSFSTRLLNTEVVLKDNQVLIMGGLMRTDTIDSNEGIPILRKIPWLGKLFSTDVDSTKKTELMIFITPHIISNAEDSDYVTKQFQRRLGSFKKDLDRS